MDLKTAVDLTSIARDITLDKMLRDRLQSTDIVVVDDVSLLSGRLIDLADLVARMARNVTDEWFGGLQLIFVGDFYQMGPVDLSTNGWAFEASAWSAVQAVVNLKQNYRAAIDPVYCEHLTCIRQGLPLVASDLRYLLNAKQDPTAIAIFSTNDEVDNYNRMKLQELQGPHFVYKPHAISGSSTPALVLCKDCPVLTTRTVTIDGYRLPAGTRGHVFTFQRFKSSPERDFWELQESKQVPIVHFPDFGTVPVYPARDEHGPVQIPLALAFAATAHRVQGRGVRQAKIDPTRIFAHGQLYAMMSRVSSSSDIQLLGIGTTTQLQSVLDKSRSCIDKKVVDFYRNLLGC